MRVGLPDLVKVCMCDVLRGDEDWWCPLHGLIKVADEKVQSRWLR